MSLGFIGRYNISNFSRISDHIYSNSDKRSNILKLLFPNRGFDPYNWRNRIDSRTDADGIRIRIFPKYSSGITYTASLKIAENTPNIYIAKIETGLMMKISLYVISIFLPIISIYIFLSSDHYYRTVNGINQVVEGKPYFVLLFPIIFNAIWWSIHLVIMKGYTKKLKIFISEVIKAEET